MRKRFALVVVSAVVAFASFVEAQPVEKQTILTITAQEIDGGILSEITWDGDTLVLQGAVAEPTGELSARYLVVPANGVGLKKLKEAPPAVQKYWNRKANRTSPTGLGKIVGGSDRSMPIYGVAGLQQRIHDAAEMGGMQERHVLRIGGLILHERTNEVEPYDGEIWSWSPAELNRIAYTDGKGNLWIARADGRDARRVLKGRFTLPAWSDDGRTLAIAEKKDGGRKWVISLVHLPEELRVN
jgi:hypothetical protein